MKTSFSKLLSLLLALLLLLSAAPAALAEEEEEPEESLIDEAYLNQWMEEYLQSRGITYDWQDFSVGFCYTATGDCWFYDADVFMYSASLYKVPVCMMIAEEIAAGDFTWTDTIQGSTVEYLVRSALVYSNNDFGHVLVSFLGGSYRGKCSDRSIAYTDLDPAYFPREFTEQSYYSARYMTRVMQTLLAGGEERFPRVNEYLLQAQPNEYMNLRLKDRWPVAQKYGAYDEGNGYNNNHTAAIIYTPTPIVVVVMTRNVGDYQNRIAEVGEFLADYSLELDGKLAQREAEEAAREAERAAREAAAREAEQAAREASPSPEPAPEPAVTPAASTPAPAERPAPAPLPASPSPGPASPAEQSLPLGLWLILGLLLGLSIPVLQHAFRTRKRKTRARR